MNIAVIPARSGSKRIPKKNIKLFSGFPIMYWSILAARKSNLFDRIIVSTDDSFFRSVALEFGAEVPFIRPKYLSDDYTNTVDVVKHAISTLDNKNDDIDIVGCIYPCAPFIQVEDLLKASNLVNNNPDKFCYPITAYTHPIERSLIRSRHGELTLKYPEFENARTQDFDKLFYDSGQFYIAKKNVWSDSNAMHSNAIGLVIPNWRVVDIDTEEDFNRAEIFFDFLKSQNKLSNSF